MRNLIKVLCAAMLVISLQAGEGWLVDAEKAKAQATKEGKAVLMDFTGSDWCPPCKQLKSKVLDSATFKDYAAKKLVLLELDFPNDKSKISKETQAQNAKLSKEYKITGYPTIIVLDKDGKELGREVGYGGDSPEAYIKKLDGYLAKAK
ncbi:MAG: thioredoxin family protein [Limisphaerales bacterium]